MDGSKLSVIGRFLLWALASVLVVQAARVSPARAQTDDECDTLAGRGPERVTPSDGAGGVTLDAPVKIEFSAGYFEEPGIDPAASILLRETDTGGEVLGRVQVEGDTLFFIPTSRLAPSTSYEGTAFGIDFDLDYRFRTGTGVDSEPPRLGEIDSLSSARVDPRCDAPEGGYRIDVSFEPATDDGPVGSIEYLLYLTRGISVAEPQLVARQRNFATDLVTMAFVLSEADAVEPICLSVHAVDGVGRVDGDAGDECIDPIQGNFFQSLCSVSPSVTGRGGGLGGAFAGLVLGCLIVRRRTRRG